MQASRTACGASPGGQAMMRTLAIGALMIDDIKPFFVRGRLEICGDRFELCIRCPGAAKRKVLASFSQLTLAQGIRCVQNMELMLGIRALKQPAKPRALRLRVAG